MPISMDAIRHKLARGQVDLVLHAVTEALDDLIFIDELETALPAGEIIEDDAERSRCLVFISLGTSEFVHVVVEYAEWLLDPEADLTIVTVYRPDPARWIDGRRRRT